MLLWLEISNNYILDGVHDGTADLSWLRSAGRENLFVEIETSLWLNVLRYLR